MINELQLVINIPVEVHYCVVEVGGDFQEWERRKTCLKMGKERFSINGLEEEYFGLWAESNGSNFFNLKRISFSNLMSISLRRVVIKILKKKKKGRVNFMIIFVSTP